MELNPHGFSLGYDMRGVLIKAGITVHLSALDFVLDDGTRFDPVAQEVLAFYINCDTPHGRESFMRETG